MKEEMDELEDEIERYLIRNIVFTDQISMCS